MIETEKTPDGRWVILQKNENGLLTNLVVLTEDEVLEVFNQTVPRTIEEPFMEGDPKCKHAWRKWGFNDAFIQCNKCPAMRKVKRLLPKEYK